MFHTAPSLGSLSSTSPEMSHQPLWGLTLAHWSPSGPAYAPQPHTPAILSLPHPSPRAPPDPCKGWTATVSWASPSPGPHLPPTSPPLPSLQPQAGPSANILNHLCAQLLLHMQCGNPLSWPPEWKCPARAVCPENLPPTPNCPQSRSPWDEIPSLLQSCSPPTPGAPQPGKQHHKSQTLPPALHPSTQAEGWILAHRALPVSPVPLSHTSGLLLKKDLVAGITHFTPQIYPLRPPTKPLLHATWLSSLARPQWPPARPGAPPAGPQGSSKGTLSKSPAL